MLCYAGKYADLVGLMRWLLTWFLIYSDGDALPCQILYSNIHIDSSSSVQLTCHNNQSQRKRKKKKNLPGPLIYLKS